MNVSRLLLPFLLLLSILRGFPSRAQEKKYLATKSASIAITSSDNNRIRFGVQKLSKALADAGYTVHKIYQNQITPSTKNLIIVGKENDASLNKAANLFNITSGGKTGKEGFSITSGKNNNIIIIAGADNSGALYGCMELTDRIRETGKLPEHISFTDKPEMVLRGACIGIKNLLYYPAETCMNILIRLKIFPGFMTRRFG